MVVQIFWISLVANLAIGEGTLAPGWERQIQSGVVWESLPGNVSTFLPYRRQLQVNRQEGSDKPSSFTLVEEKPVYCTGYSCPSHWFYSQFVIVLRSTDECGSMKYVAYQKRARRNPSDYFMPTRMELLDHSSRTCGDRKDYLWEISVEDEAVDSANRVSRMFRGNPTPPRPQPIQHPNP